MRKVSLWAAVLGLEKTVVEDVELVDVDEAGRACSPWVRVSVRVTKRAAGCCGRCGRRCPGYDLGSGRRHWRSLDWGSVPVYLEADAPRVRCRVHGPTVAAVPWARHGAGHTRTFDAQVAWLATQCSKTAVVQLMRVAWRTVGAILARVWADTDKATDRLAGLTRIGIDEISYKRGFKFVTVVINHDTGALVWAAPGRDRATLHTFFDELGAQRSAAITHVSADGAAWIEAVVRDRCPQAVRCADPFHVVRWATQALDEVRRDAWNAARRTPGGSRTGYAAGGRRYTRATGHAQALKGARWALWKNPENLTDKQAATLAWIAVADPRVHRAYLGKERLRLIFQMPPQDAGPALSSWLQWAQRSRLPSFVALGTRIAAHHDAIMASIEHHLSNGPTESVNAKTRLITRMAYGFHGPEPLIALAMLKLGPTPPTLPGRNHPRIRQ